MARSPRVTVLMTVYNGGRYLAEALESVLGQTFGDFEFLIIDDASTDDSVERVRRYQDARIRLVCNERNLGQAASLNKGLALAAGAYIARLDQDDRCAPDRLRQQVEWLDRHPDAAAVGTWMCTITPEGRKTGVVGMRVPDFGSFLGLLLSTASPLGHPTVMCRARAVLEAGGYDVSFAPCEDYELWCRLALRRRSVGVITNPLVMLRIHGQQQSVTKRAMQQQRVQRAHHRLVASYVPDEQRAALVSRLLQTDETWWAACPSRRAVQSVVDALDEMLRTMRTACRLTAQEAASLERAVCWWLGRRAFVAILHQQRQSVTVYRRALRGGVGTWRYAAVLAYPFCWLCSPMFRPGIREACLRAAYGLNRQQYVIRLVAKRLMGSMT